MFAIGFELDWQETSTEYQETWLGQILGLGMVNYCGSMPTIQYSDKFLPNRRKRSSSGHGAENVLHDSECEQEGNFWKLPDGEVGSFTIDTLCDDTQYKKFYIKNAHNAQYMNM